MARLALRWAGDPNATGDDAARPEAAAAPGSSGGPIGTLRLRHDQAHAHRHDQDRVSERSQPVAPTRADTAARRLEDIVRSCKIAFALVAGFSIATNFLMLTVPLYMLQIYDRVLATHNVDTLLALTVMALTAIVVLGALEAVRTRLTSAVGIWLDKELAPDVLDSGISETLRSRQAGGAQGLRDLTALRSYIGGPGVLPLFDAPFVFVFLAVVVLLHPILGGIAIAGAVVLFGLALLNELATRSLTSAANAQSTVAFNEADLAIRNADVIAAMGMSENLRRRWRDASAGFLDLQGRVNQRTSSIAAIARFTRFGLQITVLAVGAFLVTLGDITGGVMIAAAIITSRAMAPVEQSINGWRAFLIAQDAYRRIKERIQKLGMDSNSMMTLPDPVGALGVEAVTYFPPGGSEPILRNVSFELEPGDALGIIGPTSAGKSTLARQLVGSLVPTRGHVRLDGADLSNWNEIDRGRHIGYVPQDVELFNGTVRDNIARMGEAGDAEVVEAAKLAGVHETILHLPQGYDTVIGDGHVVLSGGRRQRIALARAVFGKPKLVVLDEPNSNLDSAGEQALIESLDRLKAAGTTIVLISHRPATLARMDKLLVLLDGVVEQFGTREELARELRTPRAVRSVDTDGQETGTRPHTAGGDRP